MTRSKEAIGAKIQGCCDENRFQTTAVREETDGYYQHQCLQLQWNHRARRPRDGGGTMPNLSHRPLMPPVPRRHHRHRHRKRCCWSYYLSRPWHAGIVSPRPAHWHEPPSYRTRSICRPPRPPRADSDATGGLHNCSEGGPCLSVDENSWRRCSCLWLGIKRHEMCCLWRR